MTSSLYFIHGLGGHAFGSWSFNRGAPRMWPRDFLAKDLPNRPRHPSDPNGPRLAGRISTIGYNAHAQRTYSPTTTIEKAAEDLLERIRTDRPEVRQSHWNGHCLTLKSDPFSNRALTVLCILPVTVSADSSLAR